MFRRGLYAGSTALGLCGIWAYCAGAGEQGGSQKRIVHHMTEDHIASLENRPDLELKFVQVFFRHGARTPIVSLKPEQLEQVEWIHDDLFTGAQHTYIDYEVYSLTGGAQPYLKVEDKYRKTPLPGGAVRGQLTALGRDQCYRLGSRLRQHYQDKLNFLPKEFQSQDFYFRSTNIVRTIESLRSVVAGLCSPLKGPAKIHVDCNATEILYPNNEACPALHDFSAAIFKNTDVVPGLKPHNKALHTSLGIDTQEDRHRVSFVYIRDVLRAREAHGHFIPKFLESQLDQIDVHAVDMEAYLCSGAEADKVPDLAVLQLTIGNCLRFIASNLEAAANSKCKNKIQLYSCHDTSLIPLLISLDLFPNAWPNWAADIIFELYQDKKGKSYVRTLYLGEEKQILGTKESLVPLEKFQSEIKPMTIEWDEFKHICQVPKQ